MSGACADHTFIEALCCGDCYVINWTYLAAYVPGVRPDREVYTLANIDSALARGDS